MTTDRPVFSVCSGVLAASLLLVLSPSAYADDMGGLWPVKDSAVVSAHESGLDGSGVKIGVLDTRVVSDYPGLSDADANVEYRLGSFVNATTDEPDECLIKGVPLQKTVTSKEGNLGNLYSSHGTGMLTWLVGNGKSWDASQGVTGLVPKSDVLFLTIAEDITDSISMNIPCDDFAMSDIDKDVSTAVDWGARIINMSNNGGVGDYGIDGMLKALRHGVIIVSGRSNDKETDAIVNGSSTDVMIGDPRERSSFPGVIRNNEVGPDGQIAGISDVADANVNILSPGDQVLRQRINSKFISVDTGGTSTGSVVLSGYLALTVQKWPDATGNQILQSLVRNTKGNDSGEAKLDPEHKRGYGQVDPGRLLTVDPTQYPDVNPILEAQVTTASKLSDDRSKWYTQDCSTNPDGVGDLLDDDSYPVFCQAGEIGREYERQKAAWKKVEQCRSDGGSDCMRYSATATADETEGKSDGKSDGRTVLPGTGDGRDGVKSSGVPVWVWLAAGGVGIAVVAGGIVLAVVLSKRGKQGRRPLPDAAAAGPSPYAGPRQPVPGMAYPNRPYSPQYGGPGSRPVPQYQAPGPAQVPSQYRRNVGPVSPRYAQPQSQQPNPVQSPPVRPNPIQPSPAQPYPSCPQPSTGQVPNPADGHGREQAYPPRSNQPHR